MLADEAALVGAVCCEIGVACSAELGAGGILHCKADCFGSEPCQIISVPIAEDGVQAQSIQLHL